MTVDQLLIDSLLDSVEFSPSSARRLRAIAAAGAEHGYQLVLAENNRTEFQSQLICTWLQRRPGLKMDTRLTVRVWYGRRTGRERWSAEGEHHLRGYTTPPLRKLPEWLALRAIKK